MQMANNRGKRSNQVGNTQDISSIMQKMNAVRLAVEQHKTAVEQYEAAVEQYKGENPGVDVEAILSEQQELLPALKMLSNRELDKFITYAKEQGTRMSFQAMETGILAAGRKDMQQGLAEILDTLEFEKSACTECNEEMDNRGRSKKKS